MISSAAVDLFQSLAILAIACLGLINALQLYKHMKWHGDVIRQWKEIEDALDTTLGLGETPRRPDEETDHTIRQNNETDPEEYYENFD
jgi:hypothetical protein